MLIGILLTLCGCQQSRRSEAANGSAGSLNGIHQMADYIRNEPAVKDVQIWTNGHGPGLIVQTENYLVYTTLLEPLMLRQLPAFLESAYQAYQSQLPRPLVKTQPLTVYLFESRSQWEMFTRTFAGADAEMYLKIQRGAYTLNGACVAYNIGRKQTFSVIGHEGWHQFNQQLFVYRLPSWLDEGIATLFETCRYSQGRFLFEPSRNLMRLGSLKETIQRKQLIPLKQLLVLNPGQVLNDHGNDDSVIAFYAQNYALVRFLREYNYGIRLRQYHRMLLGGAEGSWPLPHDVASLAADRTRPLTVGWNTRISPILFSYYIEPEIKLLEKEYQDYCRKIVYRVRLKKF
jgi:hypothetical protein